MQLDEDVLPVRAGMCVMIPPGRAASGYWEDDFVLNIVSKKFDVGDEWLD